MQDSYHLPVRISRVEPQPNAGFGDARRLDYGHVGSWYHQHESDMGDGSRNIAVELDTGDAGGSLVVYVQVREGADARHFQPDDEVCLIMSDIARAELAPARKTT